MHEILESQPAPGGEVYNLIMLISADYLFSLPT